MLLEQLKTVSKFHHSREDTDYKKRTRLRVSVRSEGESGFTNLLHLSLSQASS